MEYLDFLTGSYMVRVIIPAIIAVVIGVVIERYLEHRISSFGKDKEILSSHVHLMKLTVRWISILIIVFVVAGIFGIALGRLWISISTILAMIVIGFVAGWSLIANILATLLVLIWRPFEVGDEITILPEDISGKVKDLNLFYCKLKTEDGDLINVPSVTFLQKFTKITSKGEGKRKS